jgi:RecA/RadA recombinase
MTNDTTGPAENPMSSGVPGLDSVLGGGLPRNRLYLVQGTQGAGKTTFALQFLLEGIRAGEACLHITEVELNTIPLTGVLSGQPRFTGGAERILDA